MGMRILLVTVMYYISGIVFWETRSPVILGAAVILFAAAAKGWHPRRIRIILFAVYLLAFGIGIFRCAGSLHQQQSSLKFLSDSDRITVRGIITQKQLRSDLVSFTLRTDSGNLIIYPEELTTLYDENTDRLLSLPIGASVEVTGEGDVFDAAPNEGNFDTNGYYRSLHVWFRIKNAKIVLLKEPVIGVREALWKLSAALAKVYETCLPGEESGLMAAVTLGNKSALDAEAKKLFQLAGLGHVLAVSGTHITVVSLLILSLLKKLHVSRRTQAVFAGLVCGLYCVMTGMTVSGCRAAVMFIIAMAASALGEAYDSLTGISIAALLILFAQPLQVFNRGFQLSFVAAAGVVLVANPISAGFREWRKENWNKKHPKEMSRGDHWRPSKLDQIAGSLVFAFAIQLVTLPLIAESYYEIPTYVVILNTFLLPLLPLLLCMGLFGGFLGLLLPVVSGFPFLYSVLHLALNVIFTVCHGILYVYEFAAAKSLSLPMARVITGKPTTWIILIFYTLLLINLHVKQKTVGRRRLLHIAFAAAFYLLVFAPSPKSLEITMLDVGQGDGLFLQSSTGKTYMIDGGSTSVDGVGQYRILPFLKSKRIRRIDTWFISHTDLDHCNGLLEALQDEYPIGRIVFSGTMKECYEEENKKTTAESTTSYMSETYSSVGIYEKITELASQQGVGVKIMLPSDVVGDDDLSFSCLYPGRQTMFSGVNENSLVLLAEAPGLSMLLGGDIGKDQEAVAAEILQRKQSASTTAKSKGEDGHLYIFKADHHGSNYSNDTAILQALPWDQVWISAGKNNRYHHPGKDAVTRIKEENIPYLCTIYTGQITLQYEDNVWKEYTMK